MQSSASKHKVLGWVLLVGVIMVAGGIGGCASTPWSSDSGAPPPASSSASSSAPEGGQKRSLASEFPDVMVPHELELVPKATYVFQGPKTKAGVLVYRGRVDGRSVFDFFQTSMPRENWQFKGGFQTKRSVLVFEKPDKICLIAIYEDLYYTYLEVYLTPVSGAV
ncbi:MAG TPA: hypothetical protein DCZ69_13300 [Syntrophobacteraceae bacterium]|nr:hypothetical protein [Syntrophobacteraceae bacterium]HBD09228.1 hypothetical protein [Syntrophobacteraceae bacterium]HBZ54234.1 hypothetical protein [Syntrophobacteraceae bacterium]